MHLVLTSFCRCAGIWKWRYDCFVQFVGIAPENEVQESRPQLVSEYDVRWCWASYDSKASNARDDEITGWTWPCTKNGRVAWGLRWQPSWEIKIPTRTHHTSLWCCALLLNLYKKVKKIIALNSCDIAVCPAMFLVFFFPFEVETFSSATEICTAGGRYIFSRWLPYYDLIRRPIFRAPRCTVQWFLSSDLLRWFQIRTAPPLRDPSNPWILVQTQGVILTWCQQLMGKREKSWSNMNLVYMSW